MTVCHRGPAPPSRQSAGARPRGDRPWQKKKKKEAGPEKIYRETDILTCTWGPKTALAIPARLVFLLRGVDMLWKYILFMKKKPG